MLNIVASNSINIKRKTKNSSRVGLSLWYLSGFTTSRKISMKIEKVMHLAQVLKDGEKIGLYFSM